jgi:DNA invertase Pin-like site-specific DNA recombinase
MRGVGEVIGNARVSTDDQDLERNLLRLVQADASRVFRDKLSGQIFQRLRLSTLLDYARPGGTVAVLHLDRLGRSLPRLLALVEELKESGLEFTSLQERIDTRIAGRELIFHVFGALAQLERRLIDNPTRFGLAAARTRG